MKFIAENRSPNPFALHYPTMARKTYRSCENSVGAVKKLSEMFLFCQRRFYSIRGVFILSEPRKSCQGREKSIYAVKKQFSTNFSRLTSKKVFYKVKLLDRIICFLAVFDKFLESQQRYFLFVGLQNFDVETANL